MNTYSFEGRVAIVTGAAQGIGLAIAKRLLESGAQVALWDRNAELLQETQAQLDDSCNTSIHFVDIGAIEQVDAAVMATINAHQKIDVLINSAAIVGPNAMTWEYPPDAFSDVVHIGLVGTFYVCRAVVPHMIDKNYGRIVNLSSVAGKEGNPGASAYSAAKSGVISLTKSLGKELAERDISVNCVTPSIAKTEMAMSQSPDFIEMILSKVPRKRMLELSEAASMICWLASEENSFTTAAVFDLSGGRATY